MASDSVSLAGIENASPAASEPDAVVAAGEAAAEASSEPLAAEAPAPSTTAGVQLRNLREAAGMSLAELAALLKVPERKLDLLENDQYDQLPGATFVRALASSVCRTLKADNAPILALLPVATAPGLAKSDEGINAPFRKPSDRVTAEVVWDQHKQTILIVAGLIVAAVVLFNLPQSWLQKRPDAKTENTVTESVQVPAPAASVAEMAISAASAASAASVAAPALPEPQAAASQASVMPAAAQLAAPAQSASQAAAKPASPPAPTSAKYAKDLMSFEAKADTWIEVTQADGLVLMRRTLRAGEKEQLGGVPPLSVSIGNAEKTRVVVRGKAFDLQSVSRENIARFKVE